MTLECHWVQCLRVQWQLHRLSNNNNIEHWLHHHQQPQLQQQQLQQMQIGGKMIPAMRKLSKMKYSDGVNGRRKVPSRVLLKVRQSDNLEDLYGFRKCRTMNRKSSNLFQQGKFIPIFGTFLYFVKSSFKQCLKNDSSSQPFSVEITLKRKLEYHNLVS